MATSFAAGMLSDSLLLCSLLGSGRFPSGERAQAQSSFSEPCMDRYRFAAPLQMEATASAGRWPLGPAWTDPELPVEQVHLET
jgi:hypothetical protein